VNSTPVMPLNVEEGLFLDIEAVPGGKIFAVGAALGARFRHEVQGKAVGGLVRKLGHLAAQAQFLAGHNILQHDLPLLDAAFGTPELKSLPVIDSLFLSPLAFPRNPYHRLIKNDRLTRSSKNHPIRDCDSSRTVIEDALTVFRKATEVPNDRHRLSLTRWLLNRAELPCNGSAGVDLVFGAVGVPTIDAREASELWRGFTTGVACPYGASAEWERLEDDPRHAAALAYVLAWLGVAGSDSVMPAWVRRQFPETLPIIHRLRRTPCSNPQCPWCSQVQSPRGQLRRFFGYEAFRPEPSLAGRPEVSLQEEIVRQAMGNQPLLAILPTGGGKSLCFQVPALFRYFSSGALTVVITPLQALMKDQVDGLVEKSSVTCAGTLNGLQTPPEKAEVRESVRLGGVGILYVSPEQLRNSSFRQTILQREIGCWVFDEAHCLSQWGHDFRPDYVYIARFIKELAAAQEQPVPPVMCVTATAKEDVKAEIVAHFRQTLGQELMLLDGGTGRENLSYQIEQVGEPEKLVRIHELLRERIGGDVGAAVVFAATRKRVEEFALQLAAPPRNWACRAFHAGLEAEEKKAILDDYLAGRIQVVVATNAFGMGIDKADIRLVIHADTPGSLENYLQEAGRAGRDRHPAECILLYSPEDLETQFGLLALSKIDKRDIDRIWRAVRRANPGDGKPLVVTVSELLDDGVDAPSPLTEDENQQGTKVRTALAVLEKQGFVQRDENQNRVLQARPLVADEDEARVKIGRLDLPQWKQTLWLDIIRLLLDEEQTSSLRLESFAELPGMLELLRQMRSRNYERISPYAPVFRVFNEMSRPEVGLISKDVHFSARLRIGRQGHAGHVLQALAARELALLELLRGLEPNPEGWTALSVRRLNQELLNQGHQSLPRDVLRTLRRLESDGRKFGRTSPLIQLSYQRNDHQQLKLTASWMEVIELARLRNAAAALLLGHVVNKGRASAATAASSHVLVEFTEAELVATFQQDLEVGPQLTAVDDLTQVIQYLLVYLHDNDVLELRNGKALISQAMTLRVLEQTAGRNYRRFTKGDYSTLLVHYSEKIFQIHVMGEYARQGIERIGQHLRLIKAYFEMGKDAFAARFLRENREVYERATGIESYRKIVDSLHNPVQQAIVAEAIDANLLVLAGPGSGKTRVVAHRCAYLLRVHRVRPERILVACFNRHAALQLKAQIYCLVGRDAFGVMIQTYHGLALRLLGRSFQTHQAEPPDFEKVLEEATSLLTRNDAQLPAEEMRDRILAGFSHILVDEYQDIDEKEYAFIAAIAGRNESDEERRLAIMAVGDDDQSIYGFKGANVEFIRRFETDYQAKEHYLTENYRSTRAIIDTANRLIARNTDRMKIAHSIRVNHGRSDEAGGGRWESLDPVTKGQVQRVSVADARQQAAHIANEIRRLRALAPAEPLKEFAVLGRVRDDLVIIRAALEELHLPVDWRADDEIVVSPFKIRECVRWLEHLDNRRHETWTSKQVLAELDSLRGERPLHRWWHLLREIRHEWAAEAGEAEAPVSLIRDFFGEALMERKRHHRMGDGVVLTTAHKAKGLEFCHVFVADGGWSAPRETAKLEEERRVFYVSLTRAKETLTILARSDSQNPFTAELSGRWLLDRTPNPGGSLDTNEAWCARRYAVLHPTELFLSYAAEHDNDAPVTRALAAADVGAGVRFVEQGRQVFVLCQQSATALGRLSAAGRDAWRPRLEQIQSARVIGMCVRTADEGEADTKYASKVKRWEIPIVEVCWQQADSWDQAAVC
jgi:ATP-dependent DNA helicase RecQ